MATENPRRFKHEPYELYPIRVDIFIRDWFNTYHPCINFDRLRHECHYITGVWVGGTQENEQPDIIELKSYYRNWVKTECRYIHGHPLSKTLLLKKKRAWEEMKGTEFKVDIYSLDL